MSPMIATYFDGRSAAAHAVALSMQGDAIALSGEDVMRSYPMTTIRMAEPFANAPTVLDFADGARCEVPGRDAAQQLAAALGYRKSRVVRWQDRWRGALLALALLLASLGALALWGIPWAAERIVRVAPASLDIALGQRTLAVLSKQQLLASRLSEQRIVPVLRVFEAIRPANSRLPLKLLVRSAPTIGANALALPDGTIVITDAMVMLIFDGQDRLDQTRAAQLAGVLAHEIGHVQGRHTIHMIARSSLTMAASTALFGDFSAIAAGAPTVLLNLEHSRAMETEADRYAIALLAQHGISSAPLADLFERIERVEADKDRTRPAWLKNRSGFLRSHPPGAERGALLRALPPPAN